MSKGKFVYVVYIGTTPQMAWKALVEGVETGRPLDTWAGHRHEPLKA